MPTDEPSASLMNELIAVVRDNTEKTVQVRNDVNRALGPLYQDIIQIKQQLAAEAAERPARQRQLDRSIDTINRRLDKQDDAQVKQDDKLDALFDQQGLANRSSWRRFWVSVSIFVVLGAVLLRLMGWI